LEKKLKKAEKEEKQIKLQKGGKSIDDDELRRANQELDQIREDIEKRKPN